MQMKPLPFMPVRRRLLGAASACIVANLPMGCTTGARIDAAWHRQSLEDLLTRWLAVAPTASGFMRTALDRRWQPLAEQPGYLTEHARLVYSFIIGHEITGDRRFLDAAVGGADFMLSHFRDTVHGGFFMRVAPDGKVVASFKNTYGHAFALFALSHMFRVTANERYRAAALLAWNEIGTRLRNPKGGFWGELPRDFSAPRTAPGFAMSQNPIMHLFEAVLALHEATHDPQILAGAKGVADFVVYRLLKGASGGAHVPEWYDVDWSPLPTRQKGGYTDLGHQFEWSHMLLAAEQRGITGVYAQVADRLLKFAVGTGYDDADGGVFTRMYPDGALDREKSWWQQTEGVRAFLASARADGRTDAWRRYEQTVGLLRAEFIDSKNGGWYAKTRAVCERGGCPDLQVEPYHMTGMHVAALHAAEQFKVATRPGSAS